MTVENPTARLLACEEALCARYRAEIQLFLGKLPNDSDAARDLEDLDKAFERGYSDRLADRFDVLSERATRALSQRNLDYLLDTDTGHALKARASAQLETSRQTVGRLATVLNQETGGAGRLRAAAALRDALSEHRQTWTQALRLQSDTTAEMGPGAALLDAINAQIDTIEAEANRPAKAPEPQVVSIIDIVEGRSQGAWSPKDAALYEVLRARLDRPTPSEDADNNPLATFDAELAAAALRYGSASVLSSAADTTPAEDTAGALSALAQRRAAIYRSRLDATSAKGAVARAMAARYETLVHAQDSDDADSLLQGLQSDLRSLQRASGLAPDVRQTLGDALKDAISETQSLGQRAISARQLDSALENTRSQAAAALPEAAASLESAIGESGDTDGVEASVQEGASQAARQVSAVLAQRLMRRTTSRPYVSLPMMSTPRVFAADEEAAPAFDNAFDGPEGTRRPGESMWGQVHRRLGRGSAPVLAGPQRRQPSGPELATLGRAVERSVSALASAIPTAPAMPEATANKPSPLPAPLSALMPRMAARMPNNIFADMSSARMRHLYMPVLSRVSGFAPRAARMHAAESPTERRQQKVPKELMNPEALFDMLLGQAGADLFEKNPEVAERLQASLKPVAALMPKAGEHAISVMRKYTEKMQRTVQGWMGSGSEEGVERGRSEPVLTEGAGAARTIGDYIGDTFHLTARGTGESTGDMIRDQADKIEKRLMGERRVVDTGLLSKVGTLMNKKPTRQVEAFSGPVSAEIAREMGAKAFTLGSTMFLPNSADTGLKAHEMVHAIDANADDHPRTIADEERTAYGVQGIFEQGEKAVAKAMEGAMERMDLAKEANIPAMRMPTDPGGVSGTTDPDPGQRQSSPKDQAVKEEQILEAITDAVEEMLNFEFTIEQERFGRVS